MTVISSDLPGKEVKFITNVSVGTSHHPIAKKGDIGTIYSVYLFNSVPKYTIAIQDGYLVEAGSNQFKLTLP